jgi:hypothetical protein
MSDPVRHHTVPRFYLENFASSSNTNNYQISTLSMKNGNSYIENIKNASVKKNFYEIGSSIINYNEPTKEIEVQNSLNKKWQNKGETFTRYSLESTIANLESQSSVIIDNIINKNIWPLSKKDKNLLSKFIFMQHLRSPYIFSKISEENLIFDLDLKTLTKNEFFNKFNKLPKIEVEFLWKNRMTEDPPSLPGNLLFILLKTKSSYFNGGANYLATSHWKLIEYHHQKLFTSDKPVGFLEQGDSIHLPFSNLITFPLSRYKGIIINPVSESRDSLRDGEKSREYYYDLFERQTKKNAEYIFCNPEDVMAIKNLVFPL